MSTRAQRAIDSSINALLSIADSSKVLDCNTIAVLNTLTPKVYVSGVLGITHWIVNEKGKKTCLLHNGNYENYFSVQYNCNLTAFEVRVCMQSQITKDIVMLSRKLQKYRHELAEGLISEDIVLNQELTVKSTCQSLAKVFLEAKATYIGI